MASRPQVVTSREELFFQRSREDSGSRFMAVLTRERPPHLHVRLSCYDLAMRGASSLMAQIRVKLQLRTAQDYRPCPGELQEGEGLCMLKPSATESISAFWKSTDYKEAVA